MFRWVRGLQHFDRIEGFASRPVEDLIRGGGVLRFKRCADHVARLTGTDAKLRDLIDGESWSRTLQQAWQLGRDGNGAERRCRLVVSCLEIAVEPAVCSAL